MRFAACHALLARGITGRLKVCWLGRPCVDATRAWGRDDDQRGQRPRPKGRAAEPRPEDGLPGTVLCAAGAPPTAVLPLPA